MSTNPEVLEDNLKDLEAVVKQQQLELKELKDFKQKVELGSWLIRCTAYTLGGLAVFFVSLITIFEKWPFK